MSKSKGERQLLVAPNIPDIFLFISNLHLSNFTHIYT